MTRRRDRPHGFTLVEVMLALSLIVVVLGLVTLAIDVHLRAADAGQRHIQQAQLARAVLHLIARDLRGALRYEEVDIEEMFTEDMLLDAMDESDDSSQPSAPSGTTSPEGSEETMVVAATIPTTPGIYGELNWIQVDTSRLPRLDQFNQMSDPLAETGLADLVSCAKTVAYYVVTDSDGDIYSDDYGDDSLGEYGLVRRELDRAVTLYAEEQGLLDPESLELEPLAPEVSAVEFLYFDGTEWVDYWDTEERGGLPVAVKIALYIMPTAEQTRILWMASPWRADEEPEPVVYTLTVRVPIAEPTTLETTETADTAEMEGGA